MSGSIKKGRRYETSALIEDQYEPGSQGRVLQNLIGINKKREMDRVEMREQLRVMDELMGGNSRKGYFAAVQAGMGGDYVPMEDIFSAVVRRTLRKRA